MNELFKFMTPNRMVGVVAMAAVSLCVIVMFNLTFIYLTIGGWPLGVSHYALQGIFVGAPFVALFLTIIQSQLRTMRRLSLLSRKDGLTGLNNRRTFMQLAEKRMHGQNGGVLLLLDADHFKRINDKWGHAVGDTCLIQIANRLKWNLRDMDVAGRIGGEEFAVLLSGATIHQARVIAGRIGQPIPFSASKETQHLSVTLSIGAVPIEGDLTLDALLLRADSALYAAKAQGRSRVVTWDPTLQSGEGQAA